MNYWYVWYSDDGVEWSHKQFRSKFAARLYRARILARGFFFVQIREGSDF